MKVPIQSWSLHDTLRSTVTFFLAFFLGWRMPNLIIGLSGRWAPNSWLRTQETVPNFRIVIRDTSTWDIFIWNSAHSFVHTSLSLPNTLSFSKSKNTPSLHTEPEQYKHKFQFRQMRRWNSDFLLTTLFTACFAHCYIHYILNTCNFFGSQLH